MWRPTHTLVSRLHVRCHEAASFSHEAVVVPYSARRGRGNLGFATVREFCSDVEDAHVLFVLSHYLITVS